MTDVWIVQYKRLHIGNRIEGFKVAFNVFNDKNKALQYAFTTARNFGNADFQYNEEGSYDVYEDDGYNWPELSISVTQSRFDPTAEVALALKCTDID